MIYISVKKLLIKNDLTYKYYTDLDKAIIKYQKLDLACRELRSSCVWCKIYRELLTKNYSKRKKKELLTSEITFTVSK